MLVECQCQPSNIELSCSSIVKLGLWERRGEVFGLLSVLFSHVSHLLIEEYEADSYYDEQCNDESPSQQLSVFRYLLESVFCDSKRRPTVTDFQTLRTF